MRTLNLKDPNPFYAPASDECWVVLAKEIMASYSRNYANLIPTTARTQYEYDQLDRQKYIPQRKSVLRRVKCGPLRSVVDMPTIYSAFEKQRIENLKMWGVTWRDNGYIDIDEL